jgi:hypothetical protein
MTHRAGDVRVTPAALRMLCVGLAFLALGCGDRVKGRPLPWVREGEPVLRDTRALGALDAPAISEASGVVTSRRTPGLLWVLNDSGNDPLLFSLSPSGQLRSYVALRSAVNRDWEALSSGPCPQGHCLFVGDVGDNGARRDDLRIYYLREPEAPAAPMDLAPDGVIAVRYADGPHDVEAMYVAPDTSIWLITKRPAKDDAGRPRPSRLYRIAASAWGTNEAVAVVDTLPITPTKGSAADWITDASLSSPDSTGARRLAVLTYGAVYLFAADPWTGRPGALLARCALPIREQTAEAVSWLPDGRVLVLNEGKGAQIYAGRCP